jgi:hypothetical protein
LYAKAAIFSGSGSPPPLPPLPPLPVLPFVLALVDVMEVELEPEFELALELEFALALALALAPPTPVLLPAAPEEASLPSPPIFPQDAPTATSTMAASW